jgi:hypothetical protein
LLKYLNLAPAPQSPAICCLLCGPAEVKTTKIMNIIINMQNVLGKPHGQRMHLESKFPIFLKLKFLDNNLVLRNFLSLEILPGKIVVNENFV